MTKTTFDALLAEGTPIVADGGMGTMLMSKGLKSGNPPELWNVERVDDIRAIHDGYINAGAQIVLTNSFGGNRLRLKGHGLADRCAELNEAAAKIARSAADAAPHPVAVGGSMGPTGEFFAPMGTLSEADAVEIFAEQAAALVAGGVDLLWIETMADLQEIAAAVKGVQQAAPDVPFTVTMTFDTKGRTMMGTTPAQAIETISGLKALAAGGNCGNGPDEIEAVIAQMHESQPDAVLIAKANAGLPRIENGQAVYDATPDIMGDYAARVRDKGARIIGACCGSTPDHIAAIARVLENA